jgi:hypothetical protein
VSAGPVVSVPGGQPAERVAQVSLGSTPPGKTVCRRPSSSRPGPKVRRGTEAPAPICISDEAVVKPFFEFSEIRTKLAGPIFRSATRDFQCLRSNSPPLLPELLG